MYEGRTYLQVTHPVLTFLFPFLPDVLASPEHAGDADDGMAPRKLELIWRGLGLM